MIRACLTIVRNFMPKRFGQSMASPLKRPWWHWFVAVAVLSLLIFGLYLLYLQGRISAKIANSQWTESAAVYARPLEFRPGMYLRTTDLLEELNDLGYSPASEPAVAGQYLLDKHDPHHLRFRIAVREVRNPAWRQVPLTIVVQFSGEQISSISDSSGKKLPNAFLDPVLLARWQPTQTEDRELVPLSDVPEDLIHALLATEDRHFFSHHGFSFRSIARAIRQNWRAGETEQGGSTLTQQLVKNYFLSSERTLTRKFNELWMAIILEWDFDKNQILSAYLNEIYFGQDGDRAIHGVGLASQYYFGKPVRELDTLQCALLVGLIRGPSYYSPWRHPDRMMSRRDLVLSQMQLENYLSAERVQALKGSPLGISAMPQALSGRVPAVLDQLRREWARRLQSVALTHTGLRVHTTIDPVLQRKAESLAKDGLQRIDPRGVMQTAIVITDRHTGVIRALVGSRSNQPGFNRALDAQRSVGSSLKPMIYYTALQQADKYSLATPLQDSAFVVEQDHGSNWEPKNYDGIEHGQVPLREALAHSYNLATARMAMDIGLERIVKNWRLMGLQKDLPLYPSMVLGALSLSPLELTTLYSGFASEGWVYSPQLLSGVELGNGERMPLQQRPVAQLDPRVVYLTDKALQDVVSEGTAAKLGEQFPQRHLAGKTGTTNDLRDSWFSGFDEQNLIVIWMGRDDNKETRFTGATGALQLFMRLMSQSPEQPLQLKTVAGVAERPLSNRDGLPIDGDCEEVQVLPALTDVPARSCNVGDDQSEAPIPDN